MHPPSLNFARSKAKRDLRGLKLSTTSGIDDCQIVLESGPATLAQPSVTAVSCHW